MELLDRVLCTACAAGERVAFGTAGRQLTYRDLVNRAAAAQSILIGPVSAGGTIVLHAGNELSFPVTFLAAIAAGMNVLAVPKSATVAEVAGLAERVDAKLVVSDGELRGTSAPPVLGLGRIMSELLMPQDLHRSDAAGSLLLASSGSTGMPKIVRRDAASLDAVAANMVEAIGFRAGDDVLAAVPLAHSYGIEHGLLAPLWAGASVHLFDGLDLEAIAASTASFSIFPAVPSMIEGLADAGADVQAMANVRAIYSAGAPLPPAVRDRFTARYRRPIGQLYGATEIGTVTYRAGDARSGTDVGWPMGGVSIRILHTGEVTIRSPSMFSGYVGAPSADDLIDGHFLTGDLGHLTDDGALVITGRSKLLIDIGGLKVNPLEVETALNAHPQVRECVVVPLPQSETVSRLRAIIVPRDPAAAPTADALRAHARACLAPYKVPRVFELRSELPRSATGKVLRTMLGDS